MLKKILITTITLILLITALGGYAVHWLREALPSKAYFTDIQASQTIDIPYLQHPVLQNRGKILAVVTSVDEMGTSGKKNRL